MHVALETTVGKLWRQTSSVGQISVSSPKAFYRIVFYVGATGTNEKERSDTRRAPRKGKRAVLLERKEDVLFALETDDSALMT